MWSSTSLKHLVQSNKVLLVVWRESCQQKHPQQRGKTSVVKKA
jgi:hypothetical protein